MNCIVTGGCGFIGSHVVDRLIEKGAYVTVIDNRSSVSNDKFYTNKKAKYVDADICDIDKISKHFDDVDFVFHLAAISRFGTSIENPVKTYETNCIGTMNVLQLAASNNIKKVVFSSTSAVPLIDSVGHCFSIPYIATKRIGEELCQLYRNIYNMNIYVLRYYSVYGERQPTLGEHAPVIGKFLRQYENNEKLTTTTAKRDFVHVSDVATATVKCINNLTPIIEQPIDVGTGKAVSVRDIASIICTSKSSIKYADRKKYDVDITRANLRLVKKYLKFTPKIDVLEWLTEAVKTP